MPVAFKHQRESFADIQTRQLQGLAFVVLKQEQTPCSTLNIPLEFDVAMVTGRKGISVPNAALLHGESVSSS